MKRYGNLMEKVLDRDNLCLAFHNAAAGKRDRKEVRLFQKDLQKNLDRIYEKLACGAMTFGGYRMFTVHDPKTRTICSAPFDQRVVHHALINITGPMMDRSRIFHSYACRTGKGQHRAVEKASGWAGKACFYLKMDIRKYFDSIFHERVMELLSRRFKDSKILELFHDIINSYETSPGRGLPLGNLTSQYLANFYLDRFDHWIKEEKRVKLYIRYMDDMLMFGEKDTLLGLLHESREFLNSRLELDLKHGGRINRTDKGIGFLGTVVYPGHIRLSPASKKRTRARLKQYERKFLSEKWDAVELQQRISALWAGFDHIQCAGWKKRMAGNCPDV